MNREIKFKRYHFDSEKKVIKVTQWGKITKSYRIYEHSELSFTAPSNVASADTFIDCQFTGLKDFKEKEIYEDDICKTEHGICQIIFKDGGFVYLISKNETFCPAYNWHIEELEVIGNIFENPELLKK